MYLRLRRSAPPRSSSSSPVSFSSSIFLSTGAVFLDFGGFGLRLFGFGRLGDVAASVSSLPSSASSSAMASVSAFSGLSGSPARSVAWPEPLTRTGGFRRAFGHIDPGSFYRFEATADCHGPTSSVPAVPPYNRLPGFRLRRSAEGFGLFAVPRGGQVNFIRLYVRVLDDARRRRPVWAGSWRLPISCWRARCSPSRCCSAASSTPWPAASPRAELDWNRLIAAARRLGRLRACSRSLPAR